MRAQQKVVCGLGWGVEGEGDETTKAMLAHRLRQGTEPCGRVLQPESILLHRLPSNGPLGPRPFFLDDSPGHVGTMN